MKKILVLVIIVFSTAMFAQSSVLEGTYTIGGNFSFNSESVNGESSGYTSLSFSPSLGYFFTDYFYTGISLSYLYSSGSNYSNNNYGFGPSLRYYLSKNQISPFFGFSFLYNLSNSDSGSEADYSSFTSSLGVDYFVTNFLAIEGTINYSFNNRSTSFENYSHSTGSKAFNITFGAKYFIP